MNSTPPLPRAPAALLRHLGVQARKGLSQAFLTDPAVCRAMVAAAALGADDEVLEIGPGLGMLTRALVERAGRVVAVELDPKLAAHLPTLVPSPRLEVVTGDALAFDPSAHFAGPYKLVANIPYQITSPLLTRYLVDVRRPRVAVLMLQREVAERILAPPGRATYLSNLVQALAEVRIVRHVPASAFYPRPRVASTVVQITPMARPLVTDEQLMAYLRVVRAGFTQPRKTLANSLAQGLGLDRRDVDAWLADARIAPTRRPQELRVHEWLQLTKRPLEQR